ncbi:MAG: dependent epimerase/dehydratase family protein [Planctomycetota bacterium]|nr:dependent epimerase/dehydratase family protein [Planctomycetota bacterium]
MNPSDENVDPPEPTNAWPDLPIYNEAEGAEADEEEEEDEDFVEDEDDLDDLEDEVRSVLITGANGNLGKKLRAAWGDAYDLLLLDIDAGDDPEVLGVDLAEWDESWASLFEGVDTVIHLAANPSEHTSWESLVRPNMDALCNVFHAAALAGVERIIYASSNHAMSGYRELGDMPITVDLPPRPGNAYGAAKLFGERMGKSFAHAFEITVVALRLGWIQHGANRPESLPDDWSRSLWLSDPDMIRLFDRAVEADLDPGEFLVVNGMSNNSGMRWDLTEATGRLGYEPQDDAYATEE